MPPSSRLDLPISTSIQRLHPGQSLFVHVDSRNQTLLLIDGPRSRELAPARPLWKYDPSKVSAQRLGPAQVMVSLTVDPLNREAVAKKKRDRQDIELYSVDPGTGLMSRRLVLDGGSRPAAWHVGGSKLGLLRKHRVFARGGVALEVYAVPDQTSAHP